MKRKQLNKSVNHSNTNNNNDSYNKIYNNGESLIYLCWLGVESPSDLSGSRPVDEELILVAFVLWVLTGVA